MQVFCFHLNSKSYPIIVPDVFPLAFWSGSIAIRYASYHFQNRSVPTPLHYENHGEKNPSKWKQKGYPIWKLERSDSDPVWCKHSMTYRLILTLWSSFLLEKDFLTLAYFLSKSLTSCCKLKMHVVFLLTHYNRIANSVRQFFYFKIISHRNQNLASPSKTFIKQTNCLKSKSRYFNSK